MTSSNQFHGDLISTTPTSFINFKLNISASKQTQITEMKMKAEFSLPLDCICFNKFHHFCFMFN